MPALLVVFAPVRSLIVPATSYTTSSWCVIDFVARRRTNENESLPVGVTPAPDKETDESGFNPGRELPRRFSQTLQALKRIPNFRLV